MCARILLDIRLRSCRVLQHTRQSKYIMFIFFNQSPNSQSPSSFFNKISLDFLFPVHSVGLPLLFPSNVL